MGVLIDPLIFRFEGLNLEGFSVRGDYLRCFKHGFGPENGAYMVDLRYNTLGRFSMGVDGKVNTIELTEQDFDPQLTFQPQKQKVRELSYDGSWEDTVPKSTGLRPWEPNEMSPVTWTCVFREICHTGQHATDNRKAHEFIKACIKAPDAKKLVQELNLAFKEHWPGKFDAKVLHTGGIMFDRTVEFELRCALGMNPIG